MFGLRRKLSLGFIGLLLIMVAIGLKSVQQIDELGKGIDVILKENYRSVTACQQMKKALERIDSGVLLTLLGYRHEGDIEIDNSIALFREELSAEKGNITIPGEGEKVGEVEQLFERYMTTLKIVGDSRISANERRNVYFRELSPIFKEINESADEIIKMNQENMIYEKTLAQHRAEEAEQQMYTYLFVGALVACLLIFFTRKWILQPINQLIAVTDEIRRGNLDLVVKSDSRDEIGRLSDAFNSMAVGLREFRRTNRAKLMRTQRSVQEAFNNLTEAVCILNPQGIVELSTIVAQETFGLRPNVSIRDLHFPWLIDLFEEVTKQGRAVDLPEDRAVIQHFVNNEERYYRPRARSRSRPLITK